MPRPQRLYRHLFRNDSEVLALTIVRVGGTPCEAKRKAFVALEAELIAKDYPRAGWRLHEQTDVTHLVGHS